MLGAKIVTVTIALKNDVLCIFSGLVDVGVTVQ